MSIRFACPHCQQRLTVSARKAGTTSPCPRCKQAVTIPAEPASTAAGTAEKAAVVSRQPALSVAEAAPNLPQIVTYDERPQLVYEIDESAGVTEQDPALIDFDRLSVPRWIVYVQGGLLVAVALFSFILGVLLGNSFGGSAPATPQAPQPSEVTGALTFSASAGKSFPDDGAVVIAIPQDEHPDERAPVEGLRPDDPPEAGVPRGAQMIQLWGGSFARADVHGRYRLRLPDRGKYFLLVISHHSPRSREKPPETTIMQQMGRFFESPNDLVGGKSYSWELKLIRGDMKYNKIFD